ncbi:hypothetical protein AHF37_07477 [Paragonimus kellicotti]|nr:hypothetical protein AHF37_07477 [Paragonimus kellicotti]
MLMSFPELRRDPGPMMSSTPNKNTFSGTEVLMNGCSSQNGRSYPNSPVDGPENETQTRPISAGEPIQTCDTEVQSTGKSIAGTELNDQKRNEKSEMLPTTLPGYKSIQNRPSDEPNSLKQRLLFALADMIPHKESLSLRLLVNYTIDDKDSECLVIDETLCRQFSRKKKTELPDQMYDSGCVADYEPPEQKRPRKMARANDQHVLDLSVHTERDEFELEQAMNTEPDETIDECQIDANEHSTKSQTMSLTGKLVERSDSVKLIKSVPSPHHTLPNQLAVSSVVTGPSKTPTVLTTTGLPFLDSTVLTLLPLLQQQQQQQLQQQQQQQQQNQFQPSNCRSTVYLDSRNFCPHLKRTYRLAPLLPQRFQRLRKHYF